MSQWSGIELFRRVGYAINAATVGWNGFHITEVIPDTSGKNVLVAFAQVSLASQDSIGCMAKWNYDNNNVEVYTPVTQNVLINVIAICEA